MATASDVKTKIQGLIDKSNATTGNSDADLTSAVNVLIDGFGAGGITPTGSIDIIANGTYDVTNYASAVVDILSLPGGISKLATGTFTPTVGYQSGGFLVEHGLGEVPNFCFLYSDSTVAGTKVHCMDLILKRKTVINDSGTSRAWLWISGTTTSYSALSVGTNRSTDTAPFDATNLNFNSQSSSFPFKVGATYHWIAGVLDGLS